MDKPRIILPDEVTNVLHQLSLSNDSLQFSIGDFCCDVLAELSPEGGVVSRVDVKRALAAELRCEPATLSDRVRVATLVPAALRSRYELSFHQWRACASARDSEKIEATAAWALSWGDEHNGRSASVLNIRRYLHSNGDDSPSWLRRWNKVLDMLSELEQDETAPNPIRSFSYRIREKAKHLAY